MSDQAIISGALRVAAFVVAAKAVVALRDVVIAWRFGVGPISDAYNIALALGTWLPLFLAGAIGAIIVPALIRAASISGHAEQFIPELNAHALALAGGVCIVGVGLVGLAPLLFGTGNAEVDRGVVFLLWALVPYAGLTTLFYYLANRLQARGSFVYTLFEASPAMLVILAVVSFARDWGLTALAVGTVGGGVLQVGVLTWLLRGRQPIQIRLSRASPEWSVVLGGIGVMALGQAALSLVIPIDQYFAVQAGEGVPATYGYASRIIGLATSMGTLILGRALLPILAEAAQRNYRLALQAAKRWTIISFVLGIAGLGFGWVIAEPATRLIFERGSFTAEDTAAVSSLIQYGLLQLPFYLSGVAAVQWLAVQGKFRLIAAICFVTVGVKAAALYLLLPRIGEQALMLSTAAMYLVAWALQFTALFATERTHQQEPEG